MSTTRCCSSSRSTPRTRGCPAPRAGRPGGGGRARRGAPRRRSLGAPFRALRADRAEALPLLSPLRGGLLRPVLPPAAVPALAPARDLRGGAFRAGRELASDPRHPAAHPALLRNHRDQASLPRRAPRRRRHLAPLNPASVDPPG